MNLYPKQGDIVMCDAEPHAGHEIGGHNPSKGNIRRPFLVLSNNNFNRATHLVHLMAITHVHRSSPFRLPIDDYANKINGDLLLYETPEYSFEARHGKILGHISDKQLFEKALTIFLQSF